MADNLGGVAAAATAGGASTPAQTTSTPATSSPAHGSNGGGGGTRQAPALTGGSQPTPATPAPANGGGGADPGEVFEIKVDGKTQRMTRAEIIQAASLGKAAFKRMEEANTLRTQAESFIEKFRKDPMGALEDPALGLSDDQRRSAIEKYYQDRYIARDKLTPEQIENERLKSELQKYKTDEETRKEQTAKEQQTQLRSKYQEHYQKVIIEGLEKSGLPKTPQTVARMAFYMSQAAKNGVDVPIEMIAQEVRNDYVQAFQALTSAAAPEALVQFIGEDAVKKVQRYVLERHRARLNAPAPQATEAPRVSEKRERPKKAGWSAVNKYWTRDS